MQRRTLHCCFQPADPLPHLPPLIQAIRNNQADLRTADGGEIFTGATKYDLKAVVAEDYGEGTQVRPQTLALDTGH